MNELQIAAALLTILNLIALYWVDNKLEKWLRLADYNNLRTIGAIQFLAQQTGNADKMDFGVVDDTGERHEL